MQKQHPIAIWSQERDYWETPREDISVHSVSYSETLPKSGMTRGGQLFELPTSSHHTIAPVYSSSPHLPTPRASDKATAASRASTGFGKQLGEVARTLLPTPNATMGERGATPLEAEEPHPATDRHSSGIEWGEYAPAVRRWERIVGTAPAPAEPDSKGNPRMNVVFAEWMMGLPTGHVTAPEIGLTRAQQLKAIGNGVVPQQALAALQQLLKGQE